MIMTYLQLEGLVVVGWLVTAIIAMAMTLWHKDCLKQRLILWTVMQQRILH